MSDEWPHPGCCPSSDCRGQFLWLRGYGIICTMRLLQLTGGCMVKVHELSEQGLTSQPAPQEDQR